MRCILKKTLRAILEHGNDYLVSVKANQSHLHAQVQAISAHRAVLDESIRQEHHRGRPERRVVQVFSAYGLDTDQWPAVNSVICVQRQRLASAAPTMTYYISSMKTTANQWMGLIRGHWSVENRLHWPKDVVLNEDGAYGQYPNALLNQSLFRSILINIVRLNGWQSLTKALRELANQIERIFSLLQ